MFRLDVPLQSLGLQENHAVTIAAVNTMMVGVCRDFRQSPWFCVTAVIIGGVCTKSAQCSLSDANFGSPINGGIQC